MTKFLDRERKMNELTIEEFDEQFRIIVQEMVEVYERKADSREACSGVPIHHHSGPADMNRDIQRKGRRLKNLLDYKDWWADVHRLSDVVEEAVDIANYALFLATLARMRIHDLELNELKRKMEDDMRVQLYRRGGEDERSTD